MYFKKFVAPVMGLTVADAVSATKIRFAPRRVNRSQHPQLKEVLMSMINKLFASLVGRNPAGFGSAVQKLVLSNLSPRKRGAGMQSLLLTLTLMVAALGVSSAVAADKKMVKDPTTGKMVQAPEYGGTLTYAERIEPPGTDPYSQGHGPRAVDAVSEKLAIANWGIDRDEYGFTTRYVPLFAFKGNLAESWETPDPTTIVLNIRKGVRWHDKAPMSGRELTAQDVEYNFHRYTGLGSGFTEPNPFDSMKAATWESITATDDSTVVFKLKAPRKDGLETIIAHWFHFIMPPEVIEQHGDVQDWRNLVGTGPYMLTDWVKGSSMTYTRNPDYWGTDEKYPENRLPYIDELRRVIMPEQATWLAAFRSGKHDITGLAGDTQLGDIGQLQSIQRSNPEITWYPWYFRAETGVAFNLRRQSLFNDIRVRQAMQMAIDLETINKTYYKGFAKWQPQGIVGDSLTGYFIPFEEWPEAVKQGYRYDPEGAEKLLDEAGYPRGADGIRFKTVLHHLQRWDIGYYEIAVEYWAQIGIDVEIQAHDNTPWSALVTEGAYEGMASYGLGVDQAPLPIMDWIQSSYTFNPTGHQDAVMDAKAEAAEAATTLEEQQRLVREADMYFIEQQWNIWGPKAPIFNASQPWIKGYNGEVEMGLARAAAIFARIWIDQDLKKEMGH